MITDQNYKAAAARIGCEPAAVRAVDQVEAPGGGFDSSGRVIILFEPYVFYKELRKAGIDPTPYLKQFPDLVSASWNPNLYGPGGAKQWNKLNAAIKIHKTAAEKSASYGRYQILGQNFRAAGYDNVDLMIEDYQKGEEKQLNSFVNYIMNNQLDDELRNKDWKSFARQYNGAYYWKNQYDIKIKRAYENAKKTGL